MVKKRAGRLRKILSGVLLGLVLLCLAGAGISVWSNRSLPEGPQVSEQLDALDQTRLEEALHLKADLGDHAWPGLGQAVIPISLHNGMYSYLVGYPGNPPTDWEIVAGGTLGGEPYYRKSEAEPQNFAVQVSDTWVAGMATKSEMDRFIVQVYRDLLPPVIEQVFPYRLLFQPSEVQIGGVLHECFHVFQAQNAPQRLETAEKAHRLGDAYWGAGEEALDLWKAEMNLLAKALEADSDQEAAELTRQFLTHRRFAPRESRPFGGDDRLRTPAGMGRGVGKICGAGNFTAGFFRTRVPTHREDERRSRVQGIPNLSSALVARDLPDET